MSRDDEIYRACRTWAIFSTIVTSLLAMVLWAWTEAHGAEFEPLVLAIEQVESGGNPIAVGSSGERGSCQIMPATWRETMPDYPFSRAFDRELSRLACQRYLTRLRGYLIAYHVPPTTANVIAAYNCGANAVRKGKIPKQTRRYVEKVKKLLIKQNNT